MSFTFGSSIEFCGILILVMFVWNELEVLLRSRSTDVKLSCRKHLKTFLKIVESKIRRIFLPVIVCIYIYKALLRINYTHNMGMSRSKPCLGLILELQVQIRIQVLAFKTQTW